MRAGHRRGGGFGACSSGIVWGKTIAGSGISACKWTYTRFEYPLGKPLEA